MKDIFGFNIDFFGPSKKSRKKEVVFDMFDGRPGSGDLFGLDDIGIGDVFNEPLFHPERKQQRQPAMFMPMMQQPRQQPSLFNFDFGRSFQQHSVQGIKPFTKDYVAMVPNTSGVYEFFDEMYNRLYVGVSDVLRHRLQSYYQEDDFSEHPTKSALRDEIKYFRVRLMPIERAREIEHDLKHETPHNHN